MEDAEKEKLINELSENFNVIEAEELEKFKKYEIDRFVKKTKNQ